MAKEEKIVDLKERVKVYATDKHAYKAPGTELNIAGAVAEKLTKKGWVTDKAPAKK